MTKLLCIGGPMGGEWVEDTGHPTFTFYNLVPEEPEKEFTYVYYPTVLRKFWVWEDLGSDVLMFLTDFYDHEMEMKKRQHQAEKELSAPIMTEEDVATHEKHRDMAKFFMACRNVTIPNPFGGPIPFVLCYGKCQHGHLTEDMMFHAFNGDVFRIGTPILIIPS